MHHPKDPVTTAFLRTFCLAALSFLIASIANADALDNQIAAEPVMAKTGADGIQRLDVILDSYSFTPAYIVVQAGKPVELTLKNVAALAPHNFRLEAAADGLDLDKDVAPGETATLSFLLTKPAVYEFYCDKKLAFFPSHRDKGMIGKLKVR